MNNQCELKKDVSWIIHKDKINDIMVHNINGLLYKSVECAGVIKYNECKDKKIDICDKTAKNLHINEGDFSSVETPLDIINFHTHPLPCYIEAKTIWGWPSGEDLNICIDFAKKGNLTHFIFAVEGTYIIDVNKNLLKLFNTQFGKKIKKYIEEIFQHTHIYRQAESTEINNLDNSFLNKFMSPCGLKYKYKNKNAQNIILSWLDLVNNLIINNINKILKKNNLIENSKKTDFIKNYKLIKNSEKIMNIYNIKLIQNETIQWDNKLSKIEISDKLNNNNLLDIILPEKIEYSAPFVSNKCKLN